MVWVPFFIIIVFVIVRDIRLFYNPRSLILLLLFHVPNYPDSRCALITVYVRAHCATVTDANRPMADGCTVLTSDHNILFTTYTMYCVVDNEIIDHSRGQRWKYICYGKSPNPKSPLIGPPFLCRAFYCSHTHVRLWVWRSSRIRTTAGYTVRCLEFVRPSTASYYVVHLWKKCWFLSGRLVK